MEQPASSDVYNKGPQGGICAHNEKGLLYVHMLHIVPRVCYLALVEEASKPQQAFWDLVGEAACCLPCAPPHPHPPPSLSSTWRCLGAMAAVSVSRTVCCGAGEAVGPPLGSQRQRERESVEAGFPRPSKSLKCCTFAENIIKALRVIENRNNNVGH